MRIATFNLKDFFLPKNEGEEPIVDAHVANIAAQLRRADADVVALQEVGEEEMVGRLFAGLPGYGPPVVGTADKRGIRCVIASRLPVLWSQVHAPAQLSFPSFVEGDAEPYPNRIPLRRGVVHVRVDADALGEVDVITTHFKSNRGVPRRNAAGLELVDTSARGLGEAAVRSLVQRAAEALFVRGLVDDVLSKSPDHAICVLGDLNDTIDSLPVRLVRGFGGQTLRPCAPPDTFSCFHGDRRSLIDHILVSEPLHRHLKETVYFNELLRDHGPYVDEPPRTSESDHALAVATFTT